MSSTGIPVTEDTREELYHRKGPRQTYDDLISELLAEDEQHDN